MPLVYNSDEWNAHTGSKKIPLKKGAYHAVVHVSCIAPVQMLGVRGKEEIPLKVGNEFKAIVRVLGYDALKLKGPHGKAFGYKVTIKAKQEGEPLNDDNPPAVPEPPKNLLHQLMSKIQGENRPQHMRYPVLEPDDHHFEGFYAIDDEDFDFEEEIYLKQKANQEREFDKEVKELVDAAPDPEPAQEEGEPSEPAAENPP